MISGHTKVFCIVADPVTHVKTPQMFNAHLEKLGIDAVLVPLHVDANELGNVVRGLRKVANLSGIVVTVPHKISILEHCDDFDITARIAGAANILRRDRDGRLTGANFDGIGFVRSLESAMGPVDGKVAYLAGAGGVARAIAFSLAEAGVRGLSVYNRTAAKASELLSAVRERYPSITTGLATDSPEGCDVAVNGTSVGLKSNGGLPFSIEHLSPSAVVAEVVMEPAMTELLVAAQKRGLQVVTGDGMLVHQLQSWIQFIESGNSSIAPGSPFQTSERDQSNASSVSRVSGHR
jgi:shikimate dehydrogenase